MIRRVKFGDYEFTTSGIGFGTAGIYREPSKVARRRLLESVLETGICHFDVAPIYGLGQAQGELGRALRGHREEIVIASKVGIGLTSLARVFGRVQSPARRVLQRIPSLQQRARESAASPSSGQFGGLLYRSALDVTSVQRSLEQSLRELGTEYIDILLLHDPDPSLLHPEEVYELFERARVSGKIRAWGVAGELEPTVAVVKALPGPAPIVQIRDDIFRRDEHLKLPGQSNYLITFGVLGFALPRISAHVTADGERTRKWSEAVGADLADPRTITTFLLKDAIRANPHGTVLYSTARPERLRDTAALFVSDPTQPDTSLEVFRQLVRSEMRTSRATTKDEQ